MPEHPPFEDFFAATHEGRDPLPWQSRLAEAVITTGWPSEIGVPTGLGKTACLDIAVWALASQAELAPAERTLATRTWYVVNRRLLVDTAYAHGSKLAKWLAVPARLRENWIEAGDKHVDALAGVAESLASMAALGEKNGPLYVVRLRGGAELGARPPDPSQPALVFATVPMFASRWLFRGYGTSSSMRPVDAALAGIDSLVLLDEAHLAAPLLNLGEPLSECDPGDPAKVMPVSRCRPRFVALTATGTSSVPFELDSKDYANDTVLRRLNAGKPTTLIDASKKSLDRELAAQAQGLLDHPTRRTCLVFVNTVQRARQVHALLLAEGCEALLVTGQVRAREAEALQGRLLDPKRGVPAGRTDDPGRGRLWIVATQTLEVGADLDVDSLVTQTAGVRALTQRFGRLNRLGNRPDAAGVICHCSDLQDPVYGDETEIVWERLQAAGDGTSLSPRVIGSVLGTPADELDTGHELLPGLVWEWVKTTIRTPGEAPPEAYFSVLDDGVARVSVCWRAYQPSAGLELRPRVTAYESVELPIGELRRVLEQRGEKQLKRLADDKATVEEIDLSQVRPGDVVILEADKGLYDRSGWNATAVEPVLDVSLIRSGILPLEMTAFKNLLAGPEESSRLGAMVKELEMAQEDDPDPAFDTEWVGSVVKRLRAALPHPWLEACEWQDYCDRLDHTISRPRGDIAFILPKPRPGRPRAWVRADAFDELSFDASSQLLRQHMGSVGEVAGKIATHLGLSQRLCGSVERAGGWHDLGKADPRFQRWLNPGDDSIDLLAKSSLAIHKVEAARVAAGWPRGGRHEALSSRLVQAWLERYGPLAEEDPELVVHLVASHHGHGRPSVPVTADPALTSLEVEMDERPVTIQARLSQPDWSQPARFRRLCEEYGYWGLALLESIVRLADHAASGAVAG